MFYGCGLRVEVLNTGTIGLRWIRQGVISHWHEAGPKPSSSLMCEIAQNLESSHEQTLKTDKVISATNTTYVYPHTSIKILSNENQLTTPQTSAKRSCLTVALFTTGSNRSATGRFHS